MLNLDAVSRRAFLKTAGTFPFFPDSSFVRFSGYQEIEVTRHRVRLRNLPASFDGLRIVHLTDIHHSKYISFNAVYRMVTLANLQRPDLVLLTGDYITWSKKYIQPVAEALKDLRARLGVFAVLGNHDVRVDPDAVTRALERGGIQVLRNRSARISHWGESLWLTGVDEFSYGQSDLDKALMGVPSAIPKILLAHNPEIIGHAAERNIDFVAAGHTHGGQVKIPYLKSLNSVTQPNQGFLEGFVTAGRTQMYISRGLGKVVVPVRIKCPPELPVYTLKNSTSRI